MRQFTRIINKFAQILKLCDLMNFLCNWNIHEWKVTTDMARQKKKTSYQEGLDKA